MSHIHGACKLCRRQVRVRRICNLCTYPRLQWCAKLIVGNPPQRGGPLLLDTISILKGGRKRTPLQKHNSLALRMVIFEESFSFLIYFWFLKILIFDIFHFSRPGREEEEGWCFLPPSEIETCQKRNPPPPRWKGNLMSYVLGTHWQRSSVFGNYDSPDFGGPTPREGWLGPKFR